jgi:hypothetical protein
MWPEVTGSDVSHITGRGPVRKRHCSEVCSNIQHPIGARVVLPDHILKNRAVVALVGGYHGPYTDNLCFFRCLAVHRGAPDVKALEVPTKTYYHQYLQYRQMASKDFQGVCLDDLMVLEQLFSFNVYVYDLQETFQLRQRHGEVQPQFPVFEMWPVVEICWDAAQTRTNLYRRCLYKYPGGVYNTPQTVFDRLEDEGIDVPDEDRYYLYRTTYDIEVMLFVHYLQNWKRSFIIIISQTFVEIKTSYMRNYKCLIVLKHTTLVVLQLLWKTYIIYFQSFFLLKRNQIIMTVYSWGDLRNIVLVIFV